MTVSSSQSKVSYAGDGETTEFAIPFAFVLNADIAVLKAAADGIETAWVEGTHYALSGAGDPAGGALTVLTMPTDHTPAVGETLTVKRVVALTQETDYPEGGEFPARAHEQALDKLTHAAQQLDEKLGRAIKLPETAAAEDLAIPAPEAARLLRWNPSATAIENVEASALGAVVLADGTPAPATTDGAAGSSPDVSRADHAHPMPAVGAGLSRTGDALAVRFAGAAEAVAGTDDAKAMTPLRTREATLAAPATELTVAAGAITPAGPKHTVDTEGDAPADDLEVMPAANVADGAIVMLRAEAAGRTVTLKHDTDTGATGAPRLFLADEADFALDDPKTAIAFEYRAAAGEWHEVLRSAVAAGGVAFTESFESSEQTITAGGSLTLAHGLSGQPKLVQAWLRCVTADVGYTVGDEVDPNSMQEGPGSQAQRGVAIVSDATNLNVRFGADSPTFILLNKSNGNRAGITNSRWKLVVRAWA